MNFSVIIPAHNPDPRRLDRVWKALASQSLPHAHWECLLVDNASDPPIDRATLPAAVRLIREPRPGLTHARRCGVRNSNTPVIVFLDDDNVPDPSYLALALQVMEAEPALGALGGPCTPEFGSTPPPWAADCLGLLALRDLGPQPLRAAWSGHYPACAPIGAGMVLRREALASWMADDDTSISDRKGQSLTSGGDNDIVLHVLKSGWTVGYDPGLRITHLIPAFRLEADYLARLNEAMQASWMHVLTKHGCNEWPPIARWTVPLRQCKAWFTHRAWSGPAARIAWRGACGHFAGRALP